MAHRSLKDIFSGNNSGKLHEKELIPNEAVKVYREELVTGSYASDEESSLAVQIEERAMSWQRTAVLL